MSDRSVTVGELREVVSRFVAERRWERFHDAKNLSMSIAIEAAELMEHFQWVKTEELAAVVADEERRVQITDELADIVCYVLAFANGLDIDLSTAVREKMTKNAAKYPAEEFQGRYYKPES